MNNNKNKVAIISSSLGIGGAERFASSLSFILYDLGYEVHSIIINNKVDYEYKGTLLNLGKEIQNDWKKKFKKAFLVKQYLDKHNINIIIDNRTRLQFVRDLVFKLIYGNRKCYNMIHSSKLEMYLPQSVFLAKILYTNKDFLIYVSNDIEKTCKKKYNFKNTVTINNSIEIANVKYQKPFNLPDKYFLFFGRFDEKVKNLTLMMDSFLESKIYENGYQLILMGDGEDKEYIKELIKELNSEEFIKIIPFNNNPLPYLQYARSTVLSSRFEGFPMSLLESLASGIPVIAVDCPTGPREIVIDKFNGLLIENNNKFLLSEAFKKFAFDDELHQFCKSNSKKSIEHLSVLEISKQWKNVLKN